MTDSEFSSFFLKQMMWSVPYILMWLVGLILAFARWRRHPRVSLLIVIAFSMFLFSSPAGIGGIQLLLISGRVPGLFGPGREYAIAIVRLIRALFLFVAWALVIMAIFGWRKMPVE